MPEPAPPPGPPRTVARQLVDQLVIQGVERAACVPGESFLPVLDALRDSPVALTTCRQEGGAAMMADAWGRATGAPGVCFTTRGPGAANALIGVHVAAHDQTPLVLFVGQGERRFQGRLAWQEMDLHAVYGGLAKAVLEIDDPARVGETVERAFRLAMHDAPGPVVVAMPTDVLALPATGPEGVRAPSPDGGPSGDELARLAELLGRARRPFVILGGSRWGPAARAAVHAFAERLELPVATSYRRGALFDALHPCYAGDLGLGADPRLVARVKAADLVLLLGGRLGEVASQRYTLLLSPDPGCALVHMHPDAGEFGRLYRPTLAITAPPDGFAPALAELAAPPRPAWRADAAAAHRDYLDWSGAATPQPGAVNLGEVMVALRERLAPDAIVCNGAGGYAAWLHRYLRFRNGQGHIAPAAAAMGYGPPAATAMAQAFPGRRVVCIAGDGDFLMNGQEFATQVQYGLPIVTLVVDNGGYGSVRHFQERAFPGRPVATQLRNPDFAAYARAFGGWGATVEATADFGEAFDAASRCGGPAILHLKVSPEALTPGLDLAGLRRAAPP